MKVTNVLNVVIHVPNFYLKMPTKESHYNQDSGPANRQSTVDLWADSQKILSFKAREQ